MLTKNGENPTCLSMTEIERKYAEIGGLSGFLGQTVGREDKTPDGVGRFQHFQNGSIHWHPETGAHETHGAIRSKWAELGWETSFLGYPTTDEVVINTLDWKLLNGEYVHPQQMLKGQRMDVGPCSYFQRGAIYFGHDISSITWAEGWSKPETIVFKRNGEGYQRARIGFFASIFARGRSV
jgi:hypothetical protein